MLGFSYTIITALKFSLFFRPTCDGFKWVFKLYKWVFLLFSEFWPIDIFILGNWNWYHYKARPARNQKWVFYYRFFFGELLRFKVLWIIDEEPLFLFTFFVFLTKVLAISITFLKNFNDNDINFFKDSGGLRVDFICVVGYYFTKLLEFQSCLNQKWLQIRFCISLAKL